MADDPLDEVSNLSGEASEATVFVRQTKPKKKDKDKTAFFVSNNLVEKLFDNL